MNKTVPKENLISYYLLDTGKEFVGRPDGEQSCARGEFAVLRPGAQLSALSGPQSAPQLAGEFRTFNLCFGSGSAIFQP